MSLSSYLVIEQLRELAQLLAPYQANLTVAEFVGHLHETLRERLWLYSWLPIERPPNAAPTETSQ